jgi:SEC-C motif-containing protein
MDCCLPIIENKVIADVPAKLMRSRFSAHCLGRWQYLLDSWHPDKRGAIDPDNLINSIKLSKWLGLDVLNTSIDNDTGMVEFEAWYHYANHLCCLHEISRFKKLAGRWYYLDGEVNDRQPTPEETLIWTNRPVLNPAVSVSKPGRNDLCFCGSGKKYKKCCQNA